MKMPTLGREIATAGTRRDITATWIGEILYPQDALLASKGWDYRIYGKLLQDDQVASCFEQRRLALISKDWEVLPGGEDKADEMAADFVREVLDALPWDDICDKMLFGRWFGKGVAELMWAKDGQHFYWDAIKVKKQRRFIFGKDGGLRLRTQDDWDGSQDENQLSKKYPHKFWWFSAGGDNHDDPNGSALAYPCYWPVFFKRNGAKFWATFLEKFGQPTAKTTYPRNATDPEKQTALAAALAVSTETGIALPEGFVLELLEATRGGKAEYSSWAEFWNAAISKVIVGHSAGVDATPGRLGGEDNSQNIRDDLIEADSDLLHGSFNGGPVRWLTALNYPNAKPPIVQRRLEEEPDLKPQAERDNIIVSWGYQPTPDYVSETYGDGFVAPGGMHQDGEASGEIPPTPLAERGQNMAGAQDVQQTALNGAQVSSLLEVVQGVRDGALPAESALGLLQVAFPSISLEQARGIINPAANAPALTPAPSPAGEGRSPQPPLSRAAMCRLLPLHPTPHPLHPNLRNRPPRPKSMPSGCGMSWGQLSTAGWRKSSRRWMSLPPCRSLRRRWIGCIRSWGRESLQRFWKERCRVRGWQRGMKSPRGNRRWV